METFIIIHNMIVDDEQDSYLQYVYNINASAVITPVEVVREGLLNSPVSCLLLPKFLSLYSSSHLKSDQIIYAQ
jgi:hypothetical protein